MHAGKAKAAKQKPEELDVDDFLNGGFMSVDAETDQQPESSLSRLPLCMWSMPSTGATGAVLVQQHACLSQSAQVT